jgi:hypothetical protein
MNGTARMSGIARERPGPAVLADFYSRVSGSPIVYAA